MIAKYSPTTQIPLNKRVLFNTGYLFLQAIYHELKLDKVCQQIKQKYEFEYNLNEILSRLLYLRILHPASKKGILNTQRIYLNLPVFRPIKFIGHWKCLRSNLILLKKRFINLNYSQLKFKMLILVDL